MKREVDLRETDLANNLLRFKPHDKITFTDFMLDGEVTAFVVEFANEGRCFIQFVFLSPCRM